MGATDRPSANRILLWRCIQARILDSKEGRVRLRSPVCLTDFQNDAAERLITATSNWIATGDTKHPDTLFKAVGNAGAPAYGPMGLMNASIGFNTAASTTTASYQKGYDNRGRTLFGAFIPGSAGFSESTSRGTITISGTEGSVTKTAHTSSAIITITGSEGTHSVCTTTYVMEGGISVPITTCVQVPDTGGLGVSVLASPVFTASANYGSGSTDPAIATSLAASFNVSSSPVRRLSAATLLRSLQRPQVRAATMGCYLTMVPTSSRPDRAPCRAV